MERNFETVLVEQCAPALAGLKAANLFRVEARDAAALYAAVETWRAAFAPRGLSVRVLKACPRTACFLIYVYREKQLWPLLADPAVSAYLARAGYRPAADCAGYLDQLTRRLRGDQPFPHEIGLFLGYPLADVEGFVAHKGKNYTCCGCWKSYGDPGAARRLFERYRRCTEIYLRCFHSGTPLARLAVAA